MLFYQLTPAAIFLLLLIFTLDFGGSGRWRTQGIMESNHQFYPLVLVQFPAVGVVHAHTKKKKASRVSTSQAWSNQIIWSTSSLAVTLLELEV